MVKLDAEIQVKLLHSEQFYLYCAQVDVSVSKNTLMSDFWPCFHAALLRWLLGRSIPQVLDCRGSRRASSEK